MKRTDADAFEAYQNSLKKNENGTNGVHAEDNVWSAEQQAAFEEALK